MSDPLSIGVSIITIIQLTSKLALKAKSLVDIPECIQQVVTEIESFRLVIIALRRLLAQIDHYTKSPDCPEVDAQALIHVNDLTCLVNKSVKTLERLDKLLGGMVMQGAAAERDGVGESGLEESVTVTKRGVGKWIWKEDDIRMHLRSLESQKGNLNIIIGILNCHKITQTEQAQAQRFHLLMRAIQGSAVGNRPQWERLLANGTTTDSENPVAHFEVGATSVHQTSSALAPTARRQRWSVSSTASNASNASNPLSEAAKNIIFNAGFASVEDGNFLKVLFASRVYARVSRRSTSSGDDVTLSEFNLSGRSLFSYRLERRRISLPPVALVSSPSAVFNSARQVEIFHKYIELGRIDITRALLEYGVDVQARNNEGQTPLYIAIATKLWVRAAWKMDMIKLLLEYGADVNAPNEITCEQALHGAIAATTSSKAGSTYAVDGDVAMDIVRLLVAHGADVNAKGEFGQSVLYRAVGVGNVDLATFLLDSAANIEASDKWNQGPLHKAAMSGNMELVRLLLNRGAQIDASDNDGEGPLHIASKGNMELVRLLLEHGAQIETKDNRGQTPLHIAASRGNVEPVRFLLEHGAQTEAKDNRGQTPLHIAASRGNVEPVRFLLEHGAQIEAKDSRGQTPLHIAVAGHYINVITFLLQSGANIEASAKDGKRALHLAIHGGYYGPLETLKVLLRYGADTEAEDAEGNKPRDYDGGDFREVLGR